MSVTPQSQASSGSTSYEVALFGEFFSRDLKPILNRITLNSESSHRMHAREVVFEPMGGSLTGGQVDILRARKEFLDASEGGWVLYSYMKPESVRAYPDATVRPWALVNVVGDALSFACALGYVRRSQIYKRGYVFRRGILIIQMFQQEQVDSKTQQPIPAHTDTLWEVEVKTASPVQSPFNQAIDAVLDVQVLMKGLLDLRRQDV